MITLYLARHGQTEENIARIFQGHMPGTLTVEGFFADWIWNRYIDWGSWTGLAIKEVDLQHFPADVETEAMLYERAGRFVDYLKERYDGKQVLAVGHGLINRAVQAHIQGVTLEHLRSVPKMNNAELRRFKLT